MFRATGIRLAELAGLRYDPGDPRRSDIYIRAHSRRGQAWRPQLWLGVNNREPLRTSVVREIRHRCAFGVAIHGYDVALEGRATRVTDDALLHRLAQVFAEGGWASTVADAGFTHEYSAPSAGPPPWYVYEFTPEDAYAVMTKEPGGATRWTF